MRQFFVVGLLILLVGCGSQKKLSQSADFNGNRSRNLTANSSTGLLESDDANRPLGVYDAPSNEENGISASRKSLNTDPNMSEILAALSKVEHAKTGKERRAAKQQLKSWAKTNIQQKKAHLKDGDDIDTNNKKARTWGIISFISALLIVPLWPLWFLAVVGGIISLSKYKRSFDKRLKALPIIALVISGVWLVVAMLAIIFLVLFFRGF